ncbi:hypothetical protein [Thermogemmatispora carboxidivorans]|uniref:hypothetical protein n=1 Tax=Thermogemmatispora carboxidivorans TaxID=1382306 RepID=UPI000699B47C|nr:hypothetical protein [Thermogemmatispora carboxidivorans]
MKKPGDYIGRYRLLSCLRQTPLCQFYLVEHGEAPGTLYALQLWPTITLRSRQAYIEFIEWMKAVVNLRDPALLPVFEGDVVEDHPYLVQGSELVTRSEILTLRLARKSQEPLSGDLVRQVIEQVGRGLVAVHGLDLVHGQLAPQWVLLTADGRILLSGLKPPFSVPDQDHPLYRPPEGQTSKRGDQYALAMLVRDMLSGPFSTSQQADPGLNLAALEPATQSDPQRRFASVRAFLRALGCEVPLAESPLERWERPIEATPKDEDTDKRRAIAQGQPSEQLPLTPLPEGTLAPTLLAGEEVSSSRAEPIVPALPLTPAPISWPSPLREGVASLPAASEEPGPTGTTTTPVASGPAKPRIIGQLPVRRLLSFSPHRRRLALSAAAAIVLVLLLIWGGTWLYGLLPATAATVTIVPVRQEVVQSYNFLRAQSSNFANRQVATRVLSYTTPKRSKTVPGSIAHANIPATSAHGQLVFSSVSRDVQPGESLLIHLSNGLDLIVVNHGLISAQGSTTVNAMVEQAGSQGNIPAHFVDGVYQFTGSATSAAFTTYISNPAPFTGGADAYNGPEVTQQDIDSAQQDLNLQLRQEARQQLQTQLHPGEDFLSLGGDVLDCSAQEQANHRAGDRAATVTVTEQLSCKAVAYDAQNLIHWIEQDLQQRVERSLGAHFGRVGELQTAASLGLIQASQFLVIASGQWVLQLDAAGRQAVAQSIAGLSQDEARALLLKRFHAKTRDLQLAPLWGKHLPVSASAITIVGLPSLPPGS